MCALAVLASHGSKTTGRENIKPDVQNSVEVKEENFE